MKRNTLSLAVAASVAGLGAVSTQAEMFVNDKGLGEVLIYPFYSTEGGNDTYIHIANTTQYAKAVKVRFVDAYNSAEVLDFNLYLSREDVWTAAITNLADGVPGIRTVDNSCTVPELGGANPPFDGTKTTLADGTIVRDQPFVNFQFLNDQLNRFAGSTSPAVPAETELTDVAVRGTQGYVEIIEMGALDPDADTGTRAGAAGFNYAGAVTHNAAGVPANCGAVVAAWQPGTGIWTTNASEDFLDYDLPAAAPSAGGLYGLGQVINTLDGTMASYDAVAIDDFNVPASIGAPLHNAPGTVLPNLASGQSDVVIFNDGAAASYTFSANPFDPVSALLMARDIANDYLIDPAVKGQSDWVITMPTKRPHVNTTTRTALGQAIQPFRGVWNGQRACEPFSIESWDREEAFVPPTPGSSNFSPRPPGNPVTPDPNLCAEVNILTFNDGVNTDSSALYGSEGITLGVPEDYNEGWARLSFDPAALNAALPAVTSSAGVVGAGTARTIEADGGEVFTGLPVVGFAVVKYKDESGTNVSTEGAVLNYAASFKHKVVQSITP